MTWNYRIVKYKNGMGFALHEVYYDKNGKPDLMTVEPVGPGCDSDEDPRESIVAQLETALADAKNRPVINENEIGR